MADLCALEPLPWLYCMHGSLHKTFAMRGNGTNMTFIRLLGSIYAMLSSSICTLIIPSPTIWAIPLRPFLYYYLFPLTAFEVSS